MPTHLVTVPGALRACCVALAWSTLLMTTACRRETGSPVSVVLADQDLARVGSAVISVDRFRSERARTGPEETDAALLGRLVRRELLLAEALQTGLDKSPALQAAWRNLLIQHAQEALEQQVEPRASVTEAEVLAEYQAHPERYSTPPQVRVALLQLPARTSGDQIEEIRSRAIRLGAPSEGFGPLAASSTHPSGRRNGGDLGWLSRAQAGLAFPTEAVTALFALSRPGEVSPAITTPEGVFLFKLIAVQDGQPKPFEAVQDQVRSHLRRERWQDAEASLIAEMVSRHGVQTNVTRLEQLTAESLKPALAARPPRLPAH